MAASSSERSRVHDERLKRWPKLYRIGDTVEIRCRTLSPLFAAVAYTFLFVPLRTIGLLLLCLFLLDGLVSLTEFGTAFSWLPFSRGVFVLAIACVWAVVAVEHFLPYSLCRLIAGRRTRIVITGNKVTIRRGWSCRKEFTRQHPVTFAQTPIHAKSHGIYSDAALVQAVVGDITHFPLFEMVDHKRTLAFVGNSTIALNLANEQFDLDFDPTRRPQNTASIP